MHIPTFVAILYLSVLVLVVLDQLDVLVAVLSSMYVLINWKSPVRARVFPTSHCFGSRSLPRIFLQLAACEVLLEASVTETQDDSHTVCRISWCTVLPNQTTRITRSSSIPTTLTGTGTMTLITQPSRMIVARRAVLAVVASTIGKDVLQPPTIKISVRSRVPEMRETAPYGRSLLIHFLPLSFSLD